MIPTILFDWTPNEMLEVILADPDDFLKVKETLTRIGIASKKERIDSDGKPMKPQLFQSVHILHKHGKYFLVHFKEIFALDGKPSSITQSDIDRRNVIASLLNDWKLVKIVNPEKYKTGGLISQIKIIPYKDKHNWDLSPKYTIGSSIKKSEF